MKGSVRKGGALESARNRLFARLHSHFMAELKPAHDAAQIRRALHIGEAIYASSLCNAAQEGLFQGKIFRDNSTELGLVFFDN